MLNDNKNNLDMHQGMDLGMDDSVIILLAHGLTTCKNQSCLKIFFFT